MELSQAGGRHLGGFDLDVDGRGSVAHRLGEDGELLLDAAVESAVVLVAAAGGQHQAVRVEFQELADGASSSSRIIQEVQAKLQERFAAAGFPAGMFKQR